MDAPQKSRDANSSTPRAARRRGFPKFEPTPEQRRFVGVMAAGRLTYDEIASIITNPRTGKSIDRNTLTKWFTEELRSGRAKLKSLALSKLYERVLASDWSAISFVLRHINGFTEDNINISIGGDGPSAEDTGIQISFVKSKWLNHDDTERAVNGKPLGPVIDHSEFNGGNGGAQK